MVETGQLFSKLIPLSFISVGTSWASLMIETIGHYTLVPEVGVRNLVTVMNTGF